jgi:hypothetical protein
MKRTPWMHRVTLLTACLVAGAAGAAMMRTELMVGRGLGKALQQSRSELSFDSHGVQHGNGAVGDEGYWLTRVSTESSTPFAKPLLVGDRITISSRDGRARQLEVTSLKVLGADASAQHGEASLGQPRLMLVVCRVVDGSGHDQQPVRFIIEGEPPQQPAPAPSKAL